MKRWLVALLVILALLVLLSPGIIGKLAEQNIQQNVDWAVSDSEGVEIRTERFERRWFNSEGRHRIVLTSEGFPAAAADYERDTGNPELPSLVIDTQLDHGLVPVGNAGSLSPGLANMLSTFKLDPGNGELIDLPGTLRSKVHLSGATDSHFLLDAGEFENEALRVTWTGADMDLYTDWASGTVVLDGDIEPLTITVGDDSMRVGAAALSANQVRGSYGFNEGTVSFSMDSISSDSAGDSATVGRMAFSGSVDVVDDRVNLGSSISMDDLVVPELGELGFSLDFAINRLDATSAQVLARALRAAQAAPNQQQAIAGMMPQLQGEAEKLLAAGAEVRIDKLEVRLPQGNFLADLQIDVPKSADPANLSWSSALLAATATAHVRIASDLFDMATMMNPDLNMAVGMGFLVRDGDDYVLDAEYAKGLVNVNGAPMPIPLPGM